MFENLLPIGAHASSTQDASGGHEFICNGGSCSRRRDVGTTNGAQYNNAFSAAGQNMQNVLRGEFQGPELGRLGGTVYSRHLDRGVRAPYGFPTQTASDERKKAWRPARRCVFGDTGSLAIALVTTCLSCAIADSVREGPPPSSGDAVALGVSTVLSMTLAMRAIYRMWSQLRPSNENLQTTLVDIASVYFMTVVAFGTTFAFVGILEGLKSSWLMSNANPGATLRALDGIYIITFVAAGVGLPTYPSATFTLGLHLVTWACSLMSSTFVGKILIATALSVRLTNEQGSRYDEEYGYDPDALEEERKPLRR